MRARPWERGCPDCAVREGDEHEPSCRMMRVSITTRKGNVFYEVGRRWIDVWTTEWEANGCFKNLYEYSFHLYGRFPTREFSFELYTGEKFEHFGVKERSQC